MCNHSYIDQVNDRQVHAVQSFIVFHDGYYDPCRL